MILDLIGAIALGFGSAFTVGALVLGLGRNARQKFQTLAPLLAWLGIVIALGAAGILHSDFSAPLDERAAAMAGLGVAVIFPIVAIVAAVLFIRSLRERLIDTPIALLIAVNAVRLEGVLFLLLYAGGRLPAPFAPAAGWGDVVVGAAAIPLALATRHRERRALTLIWNSLGLMDLVNAVGLGVAASLTSLPGSAGSGIMTLLPWLLIPGFLVPLLATTHIAIFYKLLRTG